MQIIEEQLRANIENAQHSTGPTSYEGKRKVSMNALKHSFAGQTCILHSHEIDAFREHFESFRKEYRPSGPTEEFLVQSLSEISWSTQQIRTASTNLMTIAGNKSTPNGNDTHTPEIAVAISRSLAGTFVSKDLNTYGIYKNRKMRLFNTTRKELLQIQAERRANEKAELEEAATYRKLCKLNQDPSQLPWHPLENGFVCSLEDVDLFIARQDRFSRLRKTAA